MRIFAAFTGFMLVCQGPLYGQGRNYGRSMVITQ
jgi:hypothetical protein